MEGKNRFVKVYSNLPINLRDEVILVLPDKGPITWNVAYLEINGVEGKTTELGKDILARLIQLNLI